MILEYVLTPAMVLWLLRIEIKGVMTEMYALTTFVPFVIVQDTIIVPLDVKGAYSIAGVSFFPFEIVAILT